MTLHRHVGGAASHDIGVLTDPYADVYGAVVIPQGSEIPYGSAFAWGLSAPETRLEGRPRPDDKRIARGRIVLAYH